MEVEEDETDPIYSHEEIDEPHDGDIEYYGSDNSSVGSAGSLGEEDQDF
jgi:hypothetical protein